ncbi:MAG: DUF4349 domain-containing protein [Rickettsiales bacterium]|nr:DUF4349 domain-containing protein [Rickettsiales bacterium]
MFFVLFLRTGNTSNLLARGNVGDAARVRVESRPTLMAQKINTGDVSSKNFTATDKKIAKTLNINIEVSNLKKAKDSVEEYVQNNDGLMDNFYSYEFYGKIAYHYSIRVPAEKLDDFSTFIKTKGDVKSENFSSTDKTENYIDNDNRLKNLYIRRDSLRDMMTKKAEQLADIISIEKELNNVQFEIEKFEKNNQKIQKSVDYSSVNLTITPEVVFENDGNRWKIRKSFTNAINLLIKFYQKAVDYAIIFLVFLPIVLLLFSIYKVFVPRRKR